MEDCCRIVRRKNGSNFNSKYSAPTRQRTDIHKAIMATKILDSICFENKRFSSVERDPHSPVEYNDVFGGPPRCFSSRKLPGEPPFPRRSYDGLYRALGKESNLNIKCSSSLPVFELPVYENSSLPVFEIPVFRDSEFPVFEIPSSRYDLGNRVTINKSSNYEFYADVFRGSDVHPNRAYEEPTSKSLSSKPSRSISKSSSSEPSSENPSSHHYASSRTSGDLSLSALASKLRPISLSKQDRPFIFGSSGTRNTVYRSQDSDNVSVGSTSSYSPSLVFSDSASVPSVHLNKPRTFSNRTNKLNEDDVFGGFPKQRSFPHMQTCQETEEYTCEYKPGPTLGKLERTDIFEKYPVLLPDSRKNSLQCVYKIGCVTDATLGTKPIEEVPLPVANVNHMAQNAFDSSPSEHLYAPQKVKSWRDWLPKVKYAQLGFENDSSTCSSMSASHVSPVTEASYWAQEEPVEISLESLETNSVDDGKNYDIHGSYGVNNFCVRRKKIVFHNKIDNNVDESSDMAINEAIAWAKEKFQGSSNEVKGEQSMFVHKPNGKDEGHAFDGNINGLRQGGHDKNGEKRKQKAGSGCFHKRTLERCEDHGYGSIDHSENSLKSDDHLFTSKKERDRYPQEKNINGLIDRLEHILEFDDQLPPCEKEMDRHAHERKIFPLAQCQCTLTDLKDKLIKEVTNDVTGDYNQRRSNQENVETLLHRQELEDAYALDTVWSGGANQTGLSRLVDNSTCYEKDRWNAHAHAVDCTINLHSSSIFGKNGQHSTQQIISEEFFS